MAPPAELLKHAQLHFLNNVFIVMSSSLLAQTFRKFILCTDDLILGVIDVCYTKASWGILFLLSSSYWLCLQFVLHNWHEVWLLETTAISETHTHVWFRLRQGVHAHDCI